MRPLAVAWFDGRTSRRWPASLALENGMVVVRGEFGEQRFPIGAMTVGENMGAAETTLEFSGGARCVPEHPAVFAAWLEEAGISERLVVRLQRRWHWALAALSAVLALSVAAYFFLLPALAGLIAPRIPASMVQRLSSQTLATLDEHFLKPSNLSASRQDALRQRLTAFARDNHLPAHQLHFRSSPTGPNAFALPDGEVVIFDQLLELVASDEEVLGIVAHELGHVAHRHGLRQLIQSSVVSFAVGMYFGDISSSVSGLGALILEAKYSRRFEDEADSYAADVLRAAGYGTAPLIAMFEHLEKFYAGKPSTAHVWYLLDSHPATAERIARLRAMP